MYKTLIIAAASLAACATPAAAQVYPDRQATGEALILVPLSLVKLADLDFGTVVTSPMSGTVAINAVTGARTVAGGVTGVVSAPGNRARFAGAGSPNQQVIVVVTPPATLANANGDLLPVLALTLEGSPIKSVDPVTRAFYFGVGGIILVGPDQAEGDYEADFDVTAIYQ